MASLFSSRLPPFTPHTSVPRGALRYGPGTAHRCIMKCAVIHVPISLQEMIIFRTLCETKEVGDVMGSRGERYERSLGDWVRASSSAFLQKVIQYLMCVIIGVQP